MISKACYKTQKFAYKDILSGKVFIFYLEDWENWLIKNLGSSICQAFRDSLTVA